MMLEEALSLLQCLLIEWEMDDVKIEISKSKRVGGTYNSRTKVITISKPIVELSNEDAVTKLLLHEIAHWIDQGDRPHERLSHDKQFWNTLEAIGGERETNLNHKALANYIAECSICGKTYYAIKEPQLPASCGNCNKKYDERFLLTYKKNEVKK